MESLTSKSEIYDLVYGKRQKNSTSPEKEKRREAKVDYRGHVVIFADCRKRVRRQRKTKATRLSSKNQKAACGFCFLIQTRNFFIVLITDETSQKWT